MKGTSSMLYLLLAVFVSLVVSLPMSDCSTMASAAPVPINSYTEAHFVTITTTTVDTVSLLPRQDPVNTWWNPDPVPSVWSEPAWSESAWPAPVNTWVPSSVPVWSEPVASWTEIPWVNPTATVSGPTNPSSASPHNKGHDEKKLPDNLIIFISVGSSCVGFGIFGVVVILLYRHRKAGKGIDAEDV
ncbi:hypothetical protein P154DRAFT_536855 [Amniculicola lignicola CBS 123094]|uniref:Mid2 domain-containing protein n=1 Tax=Amniculicola lignicola CBS 123094 TaxID=1392246 RepID=A0A6A5WA85_9PLEO|nr:hypothetical protein P154DRAFT_536855 [Amniculicola lignicola CBS 123094]